MTETKPRTEQIRFISDKTGEHVLKSYIEACERNGIPLYDLIDVLFDVNGDVNPGFIQFRLKEVVPNLEYDFQYRTGPHVDPEEGWADISDPVFNQILAAAKSWRDQAEGFASTATTQAGIATTQAGTATTQAGIATTQAGTATTQAGISTTQATNSANSATLSGQYANYPEDNQIPGHPGEYSAYHWAKKAEDFAGGAAINITYSNATSGLVATNVQAAIDEVSASIGTAIAGLGDLASKDTVATADIDNGAVTTYKVSTAVTALGAVSGATTIQLNTGVRSFTCSMAANTTFTFANPKASGNEDIFNLRLVRTGGSVTWPASVVWIGNAAPVIFSNEWEFSFKTVDGGTTWVAVVGEA